MNHWTINLIFPSCELITPGSPSEDDVLQHLERVGRTCYKSEDKINDVSAEPFIRTIIKKGHEAVLEHYDFSVLFTIDRGILQELRTHRIASFLAESTRWCNYGNKGFTFIIPPSVSFAPNSYTDEEVNDMLRDLNLTNSDWLWFSSMCLAAKNYTALLLEGWNPQYARSVLPNSLKTEVVAKMNIRQWRYVLRLRMGRTAHPQMQQIMGKLLDLFLYKYPTLFEDIKEPV